MVNLSKFTSNEKYIKWSYSIRLQLSLYPNFVLYWKDLSSIFTIHTYGCCMHGYLTRLSVKCNPQVLHYKGFFFFFWLCTKILIHCEWYTLADIDHQSPSLPLAKGKLIFLFLSVTFLFTFFLTKSFLNKL